MSFDSIETGIATGKPVRLYLFERAPLKWGYCTADRDVTYNSTTFRSVAVSDDGLRQSGESSADLLTVSLPASLEIPQMFRGQAPTDEIFLTVTDLLWDGQEARVRWSGSIVAVNQVNALQADIMCRSWLAMLDETGLRQVYGRGCVHTLYDHRCGVSKAAFKVTATVTGVDARSVTAAAIAGFAAGYFAAGFLEYNAGDGVMERMGIESHTAGTVQLLDWSRGITVGMTVYLYPGCDRVIATCSAKFANTANYGGQPHIPAQSPFSGEPVF